jgi:hypothetical protein
MVYKWFVGLLVILIVVWTALVLKSNQRRGGFWRLGDPRSPDDRAG